jgi:Peptidase M15
MSKLSALLKRVEAVAGGDLSEHFSRVEFACHCCGQLKLDHGLIEALEQLHELADRAIIVHDGFRCPGHNKFVGGAPNSEHTRGMAADISASGLTLQQLFELALQVPAFLNGGIGVYDGGFLHVDVRPQRARWARIGGEYVAIEKLVTVPVTLLAKVANDPKPA